MSILSAIKQQSSSIEDLAKLPQTMIMQMAQRKEIVPEMVPAILSKKAEMIDRAAKAKAAQGGIPQQSIMDQVMAQNAQAENPRAMGQMPPPMPQQNQMAQQPQGPADVGIASNPIPPMQMAGGGIIAFAAGDQVKASKLPPIPANVEKDEFKRFLQDQFKNNMTDTTDPFAESKAISQQYADELKSKPEQDMNMALLNTAAGMMAGDSPYFFSNVGRGAQEGVKSLAASNQQRQADKRLLLQQKVEAEKAADARKAQKSLGVERNLTDLYNREEQAATARLGYDAQIKAAEIGRMVPPSELDKYISKRAELKKQDPKGELGLVADFDNQVEKFYSAKTSSDNNALTRVYASIEEKVRERLQANTEWLKIYKKDPAEAERIVRRATEEQARGAINFGNSRGASSGGGSGSYSDVSKLTNEELLKALGR